MPMIATPKRPSLRLNPACFTLPLIAARIFMFVSFSNLAAKPFTGVSRNRHEKCKCLGECLLLGKCLGRVYAYKDSPRTTATARRVAVSDTLPRCSTGIWGEHLIRLFTGV